MPKGFLNLTSQQLTQKLIERWSHMTDEEKMPFINHAARPHTSSTNEVQGSAPSVLSAAFIPTASAMGTPQQGHTTVSQKFTHWPVGVSSRLLNPTPDSDPNPILSTQDDVHTQDHSQGA